MTLNDINEAREKTKKRACDVSETVLRIIKDFETEQNRK